MRFKPNYILSKDKKKDSIHDGSVKYLILINTGMFTGIYVYVDSMAKEGKFW